MSDDLIFLTEQEQSELFKAANRKQQRAKRPGQQPPHNRTGRPRIHAADDDILDDDDLAFNSGYSDADPSAAAAAPASEWGVRLQQRNRSFLTKRPANTQKLQQYEAFQEAGDQLAELTVRASHMADRVARAQQRHPCLSVLSDGMLQQCDVQHEQPVELEALKVTSHRTVACHDLGASFWLAVPTISCCCCKETWEIAPADIGCFGSSPDQPWSWFTVKLLQFYSHLVFVSGTSSSSFADASSLVGSVIDKAAAADELRCGPPGTGPIPSFDAR